MDFVMLGLAALAVPVMAIAGFVMALGLRGRVTLLEQRLAQAEAELLARGPRIEPAPSAAAAVVEADVMPVSAPAEPRSAVPPIPAAEAGPLSPEPAGRPSRPLDEQFGTRWAVWIGGLALALGGVFLVRYSIEQGLLGPGARVAAGALFATALLAGGEWVRRRGMAPALPGLSAAHIPSVITAAGTLTAFATVYAAHALYGLIGPAGAFVLLGVIAVLTVVAAALHGPALAGLGLAASLGTPLLVSSDEPSAWPVVLYLVVAIGAAYGMARLRRWRWLGQAAAAGALLWALAMLLAAETGPVMVHLALQFGLAALLLVADPHRGTPDAAIRIDRPASVVVLGFAVLTVLVFADGATVEDPRPAFAGGMAAALLLLAWRYPAVAPAAACAGLVAAGTLAAWPLAREVRAEPLTVYPGPFPALTPASVQTYLGVALAFAGIVGVGSLLRVVRGRALALGPAAWFVAAGVVTPLVCLIAAYVRVASLAPSIPFALAALSLAGAFTATAARLRPDAGEALDGIKVALGATAAGALAALALGLTFALDRGMLTVAFALTGLGTAWVAARLEIPGLRFAVGAIGLIVLVRLGLDPGVVDGDPGPTPIVNWLLWGYGVPALSFFFAARLLERHGRDRLVRFVESLSIAFAAFLVFLEIRHAIHGSITEPMEGHLEAGLVATTAFVFALVLARADIRRPDPVYQVGSLLFTVVSVALAVGGLLLTFNPLLTDEPVSGGVIVNSLLAAYLLPAALAGALAFAARGRRPRAFVRLMAVLALVLQLAHGATTIRHAFQGPQIGLDRLTTEGEQWAYSVALIACSLVLLSAGKLLNLAFMRLAAVAYLALAVLKVFIVDLSNLEGIMRALSFIGLGLTLIGIALVYQRLLARRPGDASPA